MKDTALLTDTQPMILDMITNAWSGWLQGHPAATIFQQLLTVLVPLTDSDYGFIGILNPDADRLQAPQFRILASVHRPSAVESSEKAKPEALVLRDSIPAPDALFNQSQPVIINDATDLRDWALAAGLPPLQTCLLAPFSIGAEPAGLLGLANRPGGYDPALQPLLEPLLTTCASLTQALRLQTGQQQLEITLREQQARYRAILDSALEAIITINERGVIEAINPATERLFGYSAAELLGCNISTLMGETHRDQHDAYIHDYLKTGHSRIIGCSREISGLRKDGTVLPLELTVGEIHVNHGRLFTGVLRDITARKEAIARMEQAHADLTKSQHDLLAILDQFQGGIMMVDAQNRIEFMSQSCEKLLGLQRNQVIGQPWDSSLPFEPEALRQLRQQLLQPTVARQHVRLIWRDPAGRRLWMAVEVRDDPRDPRRRIFYLHDQTELHSLRDQLEQVRYGEMIGDSPRMRELYEVLQRIAQSECTVLIEGETGAGKELAAHAIHAWSLRRSGPFVAINCACISETLLSSQLFGHRRGAFTGATADQQGLFEAADHGTLFLDEIGDIPSSVQAGLLRVLEAQEITRMGDTRARPVNVRVLAATHKNLATEVSLGRFRQDLFYRLRVAWVRVPSLRERLEDIPTLINAFLKHNRIRPHQAPEFSAAVMQCLMDYDWPGNVRELKNIIDYVLIHCDEPVIQPHHLPIELHPSSPLSTVATPSRSEPDRRTQLLTVLQQARGNRRRAAQLLGVSRSTLYRWLEEMNMSHKCP